MWPVEKQRLGETIAEAVERTLQAYVVELKPGFEPGERLNLEDIANAFGVSTTPVKEALKKLESHGLVEIRPRRGVFVSQLSARDVEEISAARSALEQVAVRMRGCPFSPDVLGAFAAALDACEESAINGDFDRYGREDIRFHRLFVEASGNRRLVSAYQALLDQLRIVLVYTPRTPEIISASLKEHWTLLDVARTGDVRALEDELAAHWERSKNRVFAGYMAYLNNRAGA